MHFSNWLTAGIAAIAITTGCGKGDSTADTSQADTSSQSQEIDTAARNAVVAQQPGTGSAAPVTVADIDKWQLGMAAELKAVQEAGAKLKAAKSSEDSLDAIMGTNEMTTLNAGASAAGLDPERYKFVRSNLSSAVGLLSPIEMEMNVKDMPPEMLEQMKQSRAASLERMTTDVPPPVVEALRPRAAELRRQSMALVSARLKASGAVQ